MIDLVVIVALGGILPYPLGPLLGFFYSLLADGIPWTRSQGQWAHGQSIGKRILGLVVVDQQTQKPIGVRASLLRNSPVGVAAFFAIIPFWGWLIFALIGLPLLVMEVYLMVRIEAGHRLGDVMGDTEVRVRV